MRALLPVLTLLLLLPAAGAHAAFPGQNGKIAFEDDGQVWVMDADGFDPVRIDGYGPEAAFVGPAWSPGGTRIVTTYYSAVDQSHLLTMNGDGSAQSFMPNTSDLDSAASWSPDGTRLVFEFEYIEGGPRGLRTAAVDGTNVQPAGDGRGPAWSPNGTRIAFALGRPDICTTCAGIYTADPDGSDVAEVYLHNDTVRQPDWSPDGRRLIFAREDGDVNTTEVYVVDVDGTDPTRLTSNPVRDEAPAWSPDGAKIAFSRVTPACCDSTVHVMNADGTGEVALRSGYGPDWQPIPVNAYPRPKGASPTDVSLVPAYEPCTSPNRTHGPPLAFESCNPPTQKPGQLTVGTPDANGQPAKLRANIRINPLRGLPSTPADEADVRLRATVNDVRLRSDLSDYTGDLEVRLTVQITDKDNTPHPGGPGPATVQELIHSHPLPCATTPADSTAGSTCQFDTTVEAVVPGAVKELIRGIWELKRITVHDGAGDLFLTQGIFVP